MTGGESDLESWGRAVLEEVLVRTGLSRSSAETAPEAGATLVFRVVADAAGRGLVLEFDRVAGGPERLRVSLDG
jgi:hypothetical protein